jgi:hypothetical protein
VRQREMDQLDAKHLCRVAGGHALNGRSGDAATVSRWTWDSSTTGPCAPNRPDSDGPMTNAGGGGSGLLSG